MANITETQAQQAEKLAGAYTQPNSGVPQVVIPAGYELHNLEKDQPVPYRARGTTTARDVKSFAVLVNEFAGSQTKLYGSFAPPGFRAIFNGNSAEGGPGWADHRVDYACPLSVEWKRWNDSNKKQMNQADFAQFIEDNLPDLLDGATLLEVSRTLQAKKKVNFSSGIRLSDGQNEFTYEEQIEGTAGKGKFKVPETFDIGIAVFEGGPLYKVTARLRYRISNEGGLALWYDLERPHKILEDAVKAVWSEIEAATKKTILNASV